MSCVEWFGEPNAGFYPWPQTSAKTQLNARAQGLSACAEDHGLWPWGSIPKPWCHRVGQGFFFQPTTNLIPTSFLKFMTRGSQS